ncbi:MAG: GGDEF domain-containing protein, partial [Endomicrobiia bacterium]|nr:GGDEF domain-containing protein [Endomicrobiia bacterium]
HIFSGTAVAASLLAFFTIISLVGAIAASSVVNRATFVSSLALSWAVFFASLKYAAIIDSRRAAFAEKSEELEISLNETLRRQDERLEASAACERRIENYSKMAAFLRAVCGFLGAEDFFAALSGRFAGYLGEGVILSFRDAPPAFVSAAGEDARGSPEAGAFLVSDDSRRIAASFLDEVPGREWVLIEKTSCALTDDDKRFLSLAIDFSRTAAANAALYEKTQKLSILDELTGTYLRGYLTERFDEEFMLARGHGAPLSALMFDIDHFKSINDEYGHTAGDEVLKAVAHSLRRRLRETDIVGRYGGEEFVAVMPHTDATAALAAAQEVRSMIEHEKFFAGPVSSALRVTVSVGAATMESSDDSWQQILSRADKMLYAAKISGRNRVMPSPDTLSGAKKTAPIKKG